MRELGCNASFKNEEVGYLRKVHCRIKRHVFRACIFVKDHSKLGIFLSIGLSCDKKTETIAFSGISLLSIAVFAGIHTSQYLNSTGWGLFIGSIIAILSIYIFLKYIN